MKFGIAGLGSILTFSFAAMFSSQAFAAEDVRCNRAQTYCEVQSKRLTIGDFVGIINEYEEIVAKGVVVDMDGELRKVQIEENHGEIKSSHRVATLGTDFHPQVSEDFRTYQKAEKIVVGASGLASNLSIGNGAFAYGFEGNGQMHYKGPIYLTARAGLMMAEATAGRIKGDIDTVDLPMAVNIITAIPGVAYVHRASAPVSFKAEAGLGLGYVIGDVAGDSKLSNYQVGIEEGANLAMTLKAGATAKFGKFRPEAFAEYLSVGEANSFGFNIGALIELK